MLGNFVAGRYSSVLTPAGASPASLGLQEEGYRISWRVKADVIQKTDGFGAAPIESFFLGQEVFCSMVCKEHLANVHRAINPFNGWAGTGATSFNFGTVGKAATDNAGSLVLTATAGTPAATSPATLTAAFVLLAEDFDVDLLFGPQHRVFPVRFRIWPYDSGGGVIKHFVST